MTAAEIGQLAAILSNAPIAEAIGAIGGTPGGPSTAVQVNSGGIFQGDPFFTYEDAGVERNLVIGDFLTLNSSVSLFQDIADTYAGYYGESLGGDLYTYLASDANLAQMDLFADAGATFSQFLASLEKNGTIDVVIRNQLGGVRFNVGVGFAEVSADGTNLDVRLTPSGTGGVNFPGGTLLKTRAALTNGAAAAAGTLLNAPAAGDPTKWIPINDNGTTRFIPAW